MMINATRKKQTPSTGLVTNSVPAPVVRKQSLSVDQAIASVGDFGLAQKFQILLCVLTHAIAALITILVVYSSSYVGDLENTVRCVGDDTKACGKALKQTRNQRESFCKLSKESWEYTKYTTLVSEFDLLCGKEWLVYMAMTIYFIGTAVGVFLWAMLADRNQRRTILNLGRTLAGIFSILVATSPVMWLLLVFRLFLGVSVSLMTISSFVLSYDITGTPWRPYCGIFLQGGFSFGAVVGTFLAWLLPRWRWLCFTTGLLPIILTFTTWMFMIESPQWLLEQGRKGEATSAIASIAFGNHSRPPDSPLADPVHVLSNPRRRVIDMLKNARIFRRILFQGIVWVSIMVTYYSVMIMYDMVAVGSKSTGMELGFTGSLYEIAGIAAAAVVIDKIGRKPAVIFGLVECGAALFVASLYGGTTRQACIVASRFGISAAAVSILVLSWELLPSIVVYSGIFLLNALSSMAVIATPWVGYSAYKLESPLVPFTICGSLCLGSAVIVTSMFPETISRTIHATIQEEDLEESSSRAAGSGSLEAKKDKEMLIPVIQSPSNVV